MMNHNKKYNKRTSGKITAYLMVGVLSLALMSCANETVQQPEAQKTEALPEAPAEIEAASQDEDSIADTTETSEVVEDTSKEVNEPESSSTGEQETAEEEVLIGNDEGLKDVYQDNFPIGVALPLRLIKNTAKAENIITTNFNSVTCENEMKPDFVLDKKETRKDVEGHYEHAAVNFDACTPAIEFALKNNMKMRLHTLVWHSQTPAWFFTEDYSDTGDLVSREVMLKRMENYIADVLGFFNENYPGLIYAVDVCNEAFDVGDGDENGIRMKKNRWYDTVGDDYYYQAFVFARKYASDDMKLFYNDYACAYKSDMILKHLQKAHDEGLIDGIGMQSHLSTEDRISAKYTIALKQFCDAGYDVQITELDIGIKDKEDSSLRTQARKYKILFSTLKQLQEEGYPITGVTIWGLNDGITWRQGEYPLLFNEKLEPKPAYAGAMLDESVVAVE